MFLHKNITDVCIKVSKRKGFKKYVFCTCSRSVSFEHIFLWILNVSDVLWEICSVSKCLFIFLSFLKHTQSFSFACFSTWLTARYISGDNSFYWFEINGWNLISFRCRRKARVFRLNKIFLGLKLLCPQWDLQLFAKMRCYCLPRWPTFTVDGWCYWDKSFEQLWACHFE